MKQKAPIQAANPRLDAKVLRVPPLICNITDLSGPPCD